MLFSAPPLVTHSHPSVRAEGQVPREGATVGRGGRAYGTIFAVAFKPETDRNPPEVYPKGTSALLAASARCLPRLSADGLEIPRNEARMAGPWASCACELGNQSTIVRRPAILVNTHDGGALSPTRFATTRVRVPATLL